MPLSIVVVGASKDEAPEVSCCSSATLIKADIPAWKFSGTRQWKGQTPVFLGSMSTVGMDSEKNETIYHQMKWRKCELKPISGTAGSKDTVSTGWELERVPVCPCQWGAMPSTWKELLGKRTKLSDWSQGGEMLTLLTVQSIQIPSSVITNRNG